MWTSLRTGSFLAGRSLARGNQGIAAMTMLMIFLVYIDLLFLPALIQGAVNRVNDNIVQTFTSNIVITAAGRATAMSGTDAYLAQIEHTRGVAAATAVYKVGNQVSYGSASGTWPVEAIDPASYARVFSTPRNTVEGSYLGQQATSQVYLGIGVAGAGQTKIRGYRASLRDVYPGATVTLTLGSGHSVGCYVTGIYDNHFAESDQAAFITLDEAERLDPALRDHATAIYVKTAPGVQVATVLRRLQPLRKGVELQTAGELASAVQQQVATYKLISNILRVVSLLVAAVTIIIVTYIDLVNKRRQIGVERAIGITSGAIVTSYVLKALCYAVVGIGAGLLFFKFAVVPVVQHYPFQFPNGPVTLAVTRHEIRQNLLILLAVALVAAAVPAIKSVRLKILDAIWAK